MAYSYTFPNTGVEFQNIENTPSSGKFGTKHGASNDYSLASPRVKPFVNAVEIDWNNAQLGAGLIRPIGGLRCSRVVPMGYRRFAII